MKRPAVSELHKLYMSLTVRKFAVSLVSIFVPVYLHNLGYSVRDITLLFLIYSLIKLLLNVIVIDVIVYRSTTVSLLIAYVATTAYIVSLLLLESYEIMFYIIPATMAVMHAFLWTTTHVKITRLFDMAKRSSQVAQFKIADRWAGLVGPLIGGVVATQVSIQATLGLSVVCLVGATWVLLEVTLPSIEPVRIETALSAPVRDMFANFSFNIGSIIDDVLWPLYIALFLTTYQSVGLVTAISFVGAILATRMAGKFGDKGKSKQILAAGSIANSALGCVRPFVTSFAPITAVGFTKDVAGGFTGTAWSSIYYAHTKNNPGQVNYVLNMEIAGDTARVFLWLVLFGLTAYLSIRPILVSAFIIAAIFSVCINFIRSDNK